MLKDKGFRNMTVKDQEKVKYILNLDLYYSRKIKN
jgi:hypothetical protein